MVGILKTDILRLLLAAGGDANAIIDADGHRPIHVAIDRGHLGMIKASTTSCSNPIIA